MKIIKTNELNKILEDHRLWLNGEGGKRADLSNANLSGAILFDVNLSSANLCDANISNSDLSNIKTNMYTIGYDLACPEEGSFIGYKKANGCIVKLLILEDAKRSSATDECCRCDKAKVLEIENIKTGEKLDYVYSYYDDEFIYEVGEIVKVDNFDDCRWNKRSTGIHFFMKKQSAIDYPNVE